jgi:hypothetical protein
MTTHDGPTGLLATRPCTKQAQPEFAKTVVSSALLRGSFFRQWKRGVAFKAAVQEALVFRDLGIRASNAVCEMRLVWLRGFNHVHAR